MPFIPTLLILLISIVIPTVAGASPNILLVIADDMGLDATPCYSIGNDPARMPNLEQLCAKGMVFENAYAAPTCSPTRAMIMTGKYGFETGVGGAITPKNSVGLSPFQTSLFDILNEAGYASAVIGKWHLAASRRDFGHPADLGVRNYFGIFTGAPDDYYSWNSVENGESGSVEGYTTTVLTDHAIQWIGSQSLPWFLWLAYNAPHTPFHAPPADLHNYGDLPSDRRSIRQNRSIYYNAALQALDTEMGRLLASIPDDAMDNTIVIFIGDNGTPGQIAGDFYGSRGAKGGIFEGGTHVPLIVSGPGIKAARSDALVGVVDLFATISGLAGNAVATGHSIDFRPILEGGEGTRTHAYVEHFSKVAPQGTGTLGWAIRDDRHKLVEVEGKPQMLFDLKSDPLERNDLLSATDTDDIRSKASELRRALKDLRG